MTDLLPLQPNDPDIGGHGAKALLLVAIATIDKVGRKPLFLVGSAGMAVSLGTMAFLFGTAPVVNGQPSLTGASGTCRR
ncbi:MAG: MFS transporter [Nocardioidaceae bacterium]